MTSFIPPEPLTRSSQTLLLDSQIRDWVVLPLLVIMIAAGLLRAEIGKLLRPAPKKTKSMDDRAKSALMRSSRLRGGAGGFLSKGQWEARRLAWSARGNNSNNSSADAAADSSSDNNANITSAGGWLRQEAKRAEIDKKISDAIDSNANNGEGQDPLAAAMPGLDPSTMMDGMKGNMAAMVQNMVMMQGISHFFRGFVLVRVPFPLTRGFKQMFQRGLFELNTLDTSYVSSVSWYFLVMFGLRAFFRLAMGDPVQEEMEGHKIQKELGKDYGGGGGPGNQFDGPKALRAEADNLELLNARQRVFRVDDAEKKLLGKRYPRKRVCKKKGTGEDVLFGLKSGGKSSTQTSRQKKKRSATPSLTKED
ncbi:hypothetical protein ACHAWC_004782 [Mediolabrus comicus]